MLAVLLHETGPGYEVGLGQAIRLLARIFRGARHASPRLRGFAYNPCTEYRGSNHLLFLINEADVSNAWDFFVPTFSHITCDGTLPFASSHIS